LPGPWLILLAAALWGTTGTARALGPQDADPLSVGAVRIIVGGTLLALVALASRQGDPRRLSPAPTLIAATSVALYQLAFFSSVAILGVALGTIIAIGSAPITTGLLSAFRGDPPDRRWYVATGAAIVGVTLLALPDAGQSLDARGVLLAVAAGSGYALYATAAKELLRGNPPLLVMAAAFAGGAVLLLPVAARTDLAWINEPRGLPVALHLGRHDGRRLRALWSGARTRAHGDRRDPVAVRAAHRDRPGPARPGGTPHRSPGHRRGGRPVGRARHRDRR